MIKGILGLAILAVGLGAPRVDAQVPPDFRMTVISEPIHMAEDDEQMRAEIYPDGLTVLRPYRNGAGTLRPERSLTLTPMQMEALAGAVEAHRFFELDDVYGDRAVAGGDKAILVVTANGATKEVITVNIKVTDFDDIVRLLNTFLPDDRKIKYNAISPYAGDYQEIQR